LATHSTSVCDCASRKTRASGAALDVAPDSTMAAAIIHLMALASEGMSSQERQ
jgi:hypothetical protein